MARSMRTGGLWAGGPDPGQGRARPDDGAGALEYVGILAVIASLVVAVALVPVAEPARVGVTTAICRLLGGTDCGGDAVQANPLPTCETSFDSRRIGIDATAFSVKVGRLDEYRISRFGDGSARVSTIDTGEIGAAGGVGAKVDMELGPDGQVRSGARLSGEAVAGGSLRALYDFDTVEAAEAWVAGNRSATGHALNFLGGPLADGVEQVWNMIDGDRPKPSGYAVEVSSRLKGSATAGFGGLANGAAEATGTVAGTYEQSIRDGTSSFSGTATGDGNVQLSALFAGGGATGSQALGYTVTYDRDGRPTSFTLTTTSDRAATLGTNTTPLGTGSTAVPKIGWSGTVAVEAGSVVESMSLDLSVPANRSAFDDFMVVAGPVAAPRIGPGALRNAEALGARIAADGLFIRTAYDVQNGGGRADIDVSAGFKFGLGGAVDTVGRTIAGSEYFDARQAAAGVRPLTTCQ